MFLGRRIAVVIPAFNVQDLVGQAVASIPAFVDQVVLVDDGSTDGTVAGLSALRRPGLSVLRHPVNRGVGAAIATGYAEALRQGAEVVAVMAGDGQMDPADLPGVIRPVAEGRADYAKGNRFLHPEVWRVMPASRLCGNLLLSLLTKITSGYWRCFDSQCGYTAISAEALQAVDGRFFARYGYPNDLLARLHTAGARVQEVAVRPVYEGQPSGIRLRTVFYPILFVLLRSFAVRVGRERVPLLRGRGAGDRLPPARRRPRPAAAAAEVQDHADRPAEHLLSASPG